MPRIKLSGRLEAPAKGERLLFTSARPRLPGSVAMGTALSERVPNAGCRIRLPSPASGPSPRCALSSVIRRPVPSPLNESKNRLPRLWSRALGLVRPQTPPRARPVARRRLGVSRIRGRDGVAACCQPENKVSLGFVEGLNTKTRVIQRLPYGPRYEECLRLKILAGPLDVVENYPHHFLKTLSLFGHQHRQDESPLLWLDLSNLLTQAISGWLP